MSKGRVFFGGIPVAPDVEKLIKAFPIERGRVFEHSEIVKVIGVDPKSNRYRAIMNKWKDKIWDERGLQLVAEVGVGYRILVSEQEIARDLRGIQLQARASRNRTDRVDKIDTTGSSDQAKQQHALLRRASHLIDGTFRQAHKELAAPSPTVATVRLVK